MRFLPSKLLILLMLLMPILGISPSYSHAQAGGEGIAFAAYRNGQWDIYTMASDGSNLRQLTSDTFEDTDPAYSPDGTKLAFASRRNNNWDVYILNLLTGEEVRLTNSPHYDGAPSWHPSGERIAYESFQTGNLDIWQVDIEGKEPGINLTADSSDGDFAPAWRPDGQSIAFTSWREGDNDLFLLDVENGEVTQLTVSLAAEEWPAWQPSGDKLTFVINDLGDREVFTLDVTSPPAKGGRVEQITWLGRSDGPAWSPHDGTRIAAIFRRWDGDILTIQTPGATHELPLELTDVVRIQGRLSWHNPAVEFGNRVNTLADSGPSPLYEEHLTPNEGPGVEPYNLIRQDDLVTGTPWLADTVDDSFQAWRSRLYQESGYDFLSELSDASRAVGTYTETSQYASWHKSGRAVDTLFDLWDGSQLVHEIVREDYSGETYWRIFMRCLDQSGQCGRPLTANAWNYSARARTEIAPEQGGIEKPNLTGYYVDMTEMAREYGWDRISSYDDVDYSWTWHFLAFEYWHYQKRLEDNPGSGSEAGNWYQAMQQVYPQETLDQYFNWEKMHSLDEDPYLIALKGIPLPLEIKPWWALVKQ